jgi:glycosyltransferase involved in cell wall biosynthesis
MTETKVSVCLITYNHERFIGQAVESVLEQQTDFAYELVIGEDCSTDRTREILIDFQNRFPDKITLLLWEENLGLQGKNNLVKTLAECTGQYVAFLEGDDYWIDPNKLQKQVAFLDAHPTFSMCAHNTQVISFPDDVALYIYTPPGQKKISKLVDVLEDYRWHTSSILFRKGIYDNIPKLFYRFHSVDWLLYIIAAEHGNIGFIDEVMSVYRVHQGGIWSPLKREEKWNISWFQYNELYNHYGNKYHSSLMRFLSNRIKLAGQEFFEQKIKQDPLIDELPMEPDKFFNLLMTNIKLSKVTIIRFRLIFLSSFYVALGFHYYRDQNIGEALKYLILASIYNPTWLTNKGVWSILGEFLFGKKIAKYLRQRF